MYVPKNLIYILYVQPSFMCGFVNFICLFMLVTHIKCFGFKMLHYLLRLDGHCFGVSVGLVKLS